MIHWKNVLMVNDEEIDKFLEEGYSVIEIHYDDEGNRYWEIGMEVTNEEG